MRCSMPCPGLMYMHELTESNCLTAGVVLIERVAVALLLLMSHGARLALVAIPGGKGSKNPAGSHRPGDLPQRVVHTTRTGRDESRRRIRRIYANSSDGRAWGEEEWMTTTPACREEVAMAVGNRSASAGGFVTRWNISCWYGRSVWRPANGATAAFGQVDAVSGEASYHTAACW